MSFEAKSGSRILSNFSGSILTVSFTKSHNQILYEPETKNKLQHLTVGQVFDPRSVDEEVDEEWD